MKIDKQAIIDLCEVDERRISNIYMYGSQVYGTNTPSSDYDILVMACSLYAHKEFHDGTYNVHIKTPDIFIDELWKHKMYAMECFYAPPFATIQETKLIEFTPDLIKLKRSALSESHCSWIRGKMMLRDGSVHRGMKSLWHSLRILMFANQILKQGVIYDFSEANDYWKTINDSDAVSWSDFKELFLPHKKTLENILKNS